MANPLAQMCGICAAVSALTFLILLIGSFSSLEYNEYGLDYSWVTKSVNEKPYSNGLHYLGVGHHFIKFPKSVQTIEFIVQSGNQPIVSRTSDGLEVSLEISFQYVLFGDKLIEYYRRFGEDSTKNIRLQAMHILTEIATTFQANDFFVDRTSISTAMHLALGGNLTECCYSRVDFFQLRQVELPDLFEDSISLSEVKKQEIQKSYAMSNKTQVELDTKFKSASYQKNITINLAEGDAAAIVNVSSANATAFKVVQIAQGERLASMKKALKLDNNQFLKLLKSRLVREFESKNLVAALKDIEEFERRL
eukprot:TRINITY_DN4329_c0_g1_i4.p2 TRINITY_DN4329_c0_g1~~TRINITY_DN4329_c0_g1_i4.p2  ORF type:complete len:308 (-),score=28.49 TRINITY_DN4329_c0_g1_i4:122-1045(-)